MSFLLTPLPSQAQAHPLSKGKMEGVLNTEPESPKNAWDFLDEMAGTYSMPEDWSSEHDYYLYGVTKRNS